MSVGATGVLDGADQTDMGERWDEDEVKAANRTTDQTNDDLQPEHHVVALPSSLGIAFLEAHSLMALAVKERELRVGQMNDSLQAIRTSIGYKSLVYRTKVCRASSYRQKLRSFDDIRVTDDGMMKHVRIYTHARTCYIKLCDGPQQDEVERTEMAKLQEKYRPILRSDLAVSTAVLEQFTPGLRDLHASWIWHIEDSNQGARPEWVTKCTSRSLYVFTLC